MEVGEALALGREALRSQSESATADARLLLAETLRRSPTWVLTHVDEGLSPLETDEYLSRVKRCASGEPLPYVLGWWEFFGRRFDVATGVLIPRPETELLVEIALEETSRRSNPLRVIDVGTGSGCLAITLLAESDLGIVFATDVSWSALGVARANAERMGVLARLCLAQADLLTAHAGPWDVICANLPYIPSMRLGDLKVARREPATALDGGPDGMTLTTSLVRSLGTRLAPGGLAILEIDEGQGARLAAMADETLPGAQCEIRKDLAGLERVLVVRHEAG
ncbi:MAG TPA: peptide chain release factor N(5)-glutamine methyltransferase [Anaerolineales bacterium]|nr:peptide chain release factor N(5)-glutamine methyltransferase [Anaerolineales bacterium]